jgi:hypothetical protein
VSGSLIASSLSRRCGGLEILDATGRYVGEACYENPAYQEAKRFALQASNRDLLIFGGELA